MKPRISESSASKTSDIPATLEIEGIKIAKGGLGILGILERINHPLLTLAMHGGDGAFTIQDVQTALYIFVEPRAAVNAISAGNLAETVEEWVMEKEIPGDAVRKVPFLLANMIRGVREDSKAGTQATPR